MSAYREWVEQVREASPIEEIVRAYVKLNADNFAACPFHSEQTPSFHINIEKQYFHCFGCGQGGDVFRFIMLKEKITFGKAVGFLADKAEIPHLSPHQHDLVELAEERARVEVTELFTRFYAKSMPDLVRQYLTVTRKLPEEFITKYRLGWGQPGVTALVEKLDLLSAAVEAGLLIHNKFAMPSEPDYREVLRDRIIFPSIVNGSPVFLSGRAFKMDETGPKYMHQRGREAPLYNADAMGEITFVTEGPIDTLSLCAWGYPTVGFQGGMRASAAKQIRKARRVYSVTDADAAGIKSAMALATMVIGTPTQVHVVKLPDGMDPNDYYRTHTKEEFEVLIEQAKIAFEFVLETVPADTPLYELRESLDPLFRLLGATVRDSWLQANMILKMVKQRFHLTRDDIEACETIVSHYADGASFQCSVCQTMFIRR